MAQTGLAGRSNERLAALLGGEKSLLRVLRGRELTRKDRRLGSGLTPVDAILDGGIVRGRISEIVGARGSGRVSLAAAFVAAATGRGEVAAWIESSAAFDPASMAGAGVDLKRVLWVYAPDVKNSLTTAELVLGSGGFGLVVIDFDALSRALMRSAALRIARRAEESATAVLVLAARSLCGTFAAQSLMLNRRGPYLSRIRCGAPALFDGLGLSARLVRNKLGAAGSEAAFSALAAPDHLPRAPRSTEYVVGAVRAHATAGSAD